MSLNYAEDKNKTYPSNETLDENSEYNQQLRNRINQLRQTMLDLKTQLKDEKDSWEKEIQELGNSENNQNQMDVTTSSTDITTTTLLGLSMYEDPMNYIHVESQNLQRQLAISNYRRRLLEPLRMMASEWESSKEPDECGECLYPTLKSGEYNFMEDSKLRELSSFDINSKFAGDMNTFSNVNTELPDSSSVSNKSNYQNDEKKYHSRSTIWCNDYLATE
ncbi:hypothetical protein Trydic_g19006 [Trypoxylus dichotomus]